jgi:hypothetical protein
LRFVVARLPIAFVSSFEVISVPTPAAYGVYPPHVALQQVVQTLNQFGFSKESICMMVSPKHPLATVVREANIMNSERAASASTAGMMAWLMKFGAVMIPTVGLFIRSRAFLQALMSSNDASSHNNSNGLVELGLSEGDAERFELEVGDQGAFVYIACPNGTHRAMEILRLTGASQAATLERKSQEIPQQLVA